MLAQVKRLCIICLDLEGRVLLRVSAKKKMAEASTSTGVGGSATAPSEVPGSMVGTSSTSLGRKNLTSDDVRTVAGSEVGTHVTKQEKQVSGSADGRGGQEPNAEHKNQRREHSRRHDYRYEKRGYWSNQEQSSKMSRGERGRGRGGGDDRDKKWRTESKVSGVQDGEEIEKATKRGKNHEPEPGRLEDGRDGPRTRAGRGKRRGRGRERDDWRTGGDERREGGERGSRDTEAKREDVTVSREVHLGAQTRQTRERDAAKGQHSAARGRPWQHRSRDDFDQPVRQSGYRYDRYDQYGGRGRWKERGRRREYDSERQRKGDTGRKQTKSDEKEQRSAVSKRDEMARKGPIKDSNDSADHKEKGTDQELAREKTGEETTKMDSLPVEKTVELEPGRQVKVEATKEQVPSLSRSTREASRSNGRQPPSRQRGGARGRWLDEREGRGRAGGKRLVPTVQSDELVQQLMAGQYECMVCCDRVKARNQVWSCGSCYHVFHLKCINKWATSPAAAVAEGTQCRGVSVGTCTCTYTCTCTCTLCKFM